MIIVLFQEGATLEAETFCCLKLPTVFIMGLKRLVEQLFSHAAQRLLTQAGRTEGAERRGIRIRSRPACLYVVIQVTDKIRHACRDIDIRWITRE